MRGLELIIWFFQVTNDALDVALSWLLVPLLLAYPVIHFITGYKKAHKEQRLEEKKNKLFDLFSDTLILILVFGVIYLFFWVIPQLIRSFIESLSLAKSLEWIIWVVPIMRWAIFTGLAFLIVFLYGKKNGDNRWKISTISHVAVLCLGWLILRWIGILFVSVPIMAAFYAHLYTLSTMILPAADPDDRKEKQDKFLILISYLWGVQRPLIVGGKNAWEKTNTRIAGDAGHDFKSPGLIWLKSHEVVGITGGSNFIRVAGPGAVFTRKKEGPLQVMDLRIQTRTSIIDVVSKDGINFKVEMYVSFQLDAWKKSHDDYSRQDSNNPPLQEAVKPLLSDQQIETAIGMTAIQLEKNTTGQQGNNTTLYWDHWALNVIEETTRQLISEKKLDELWFVDKTVIHENSLKEIDEDLSNQAAPILRAQGVRLITSRITGFIFKTEQDKQDKITEQKILTWESEWVRRRDEILANAQAESDRVRQEARAFAESALLNAIAEGLQKSEEIHPNLPRYVIATRFLSALQNYIHMQQPDEDGGGDVEKKVKELQNYLKLWQEQSFPSAGKEKQ